jgi:hypothetical protein
MQLFQDTPPSQSVASVLTYGCCMEFGLTKPLPSTAAGVPTINSA